MVREYGTGYVSDVKACVAWVKVVQQFNQQRLPSHVQITPASIIGSSFEEEGILYDLTNKLYLGDHIKFIAVNNQFGDRRGGWKIIEFEILDSSERPVAPLELTGSVETKCADLPNPCAAVRAKMSTGDTEFLVHVSLDAFSNPMAAQSVRDGHVQEFVQLIRRSGAPVRVKATPINRNDPKGICKNRACRDFEFKLDAISLVALQQQVVAPPGSVRNESVETQTSSNDEFTRLCDALLDCSLLLTTDDFVKLQVESKEVWDYLMAYEAEKVEEAKARERAAANGSTSTALAGRT